MRTNAVPAKPELAHLTLKSRERIQAALDNARDVAYSLASVCLAAHRAVHMNHEDAEDLLAVVIGKELELANETRTIAQEMNR